MTTIQRHQDLVVPEGSTVLEGGDELVLIGIASDIDAIRILASPAGHCADDAKSPGWDLAAHNINHR